MHHDSKPTRVSVDDGAIAQMVEQRTENPCVPGSIPVSYTHLDVYKRQAQSLGVNVTFVRIFLSAVAAFLAAATVAEAGMIGFVGLVVPHIARMMVGSDYKACLLYTSRCV